MCTKLPACSSRGWATVVPAFPAPTPATLSCRLNMDSASQGTRRWAGTVPHSRPLGVATRPLGPFQSLPDQTHGFSSANRPLTSRLLMVLLCASAPCLGTSASFGSTVKRHSSAPSQFLEFHNSRHFSLCASPSVRLLLALQLFMFCWPVRNTTSGAGLQWRRGRLPTGKGRCNHPCV